MKPSDRSDPGDSQHERARQATLDDYDILDTAPDDAFDDIVLLARSVCNVEVAAISLIDRERVWLKAQRGLATNELVRVRTLCNVALEREEDLFVVPDILEEPTLPQDHRTIDGGLLRFYAGAVLRSPDGHALGSLCVLDRLPRGLDPIQREGLEALARQTQHLLELRRLAGRQAMLERRAQQTEHLEHERADLQRRHDDLSRVVDHDPLTGLLNRGALDRLRARPEAMRRLNASGYTLMVVDIDRFKQVNDQHGHRLGDRALRAVAQVVSTCSREQDVAVRYGGDEFLIVLPATPTDGAFAVGERIRDACAGLSLPFPLSVSVGLASGDPQRDTPEQVFERADQALYRAKAMGRNRVVADDSLRS